MHLIAALGLENKNELSVYITQSSLSEWIFQECKSTEHLAGKVLCNPRGVSMKTYGQEEQGVSPQSVRFFF